MIEINSLVILARVIARARPHTRPKGFARAILSVQLTCEICYYMFKCAMYRTSSNFFIDKTELRCLKTLSGHKILDTGECV